MSTIECGVDLEQNGTAIVLKSPLAAGSRVLCTGDYKLTASDIDNLSHESAVTIAATDEYGSEVTMSAMETVALEQVWEAQS